jgi:hypothetical protein
MTTVTFVAFTETYLSFVVRVCWADDLLLVVLIVHNKNGAFDGLDRHESARGSQMPVSKQHKRPVAFLDPMPHLFAVGNGTHGTHRVCPIEELGAVKGSGDL